MHVSRFKTIRPLDIIEQIQQLPLAKKFFIIEQTLKAIKDDEFKQQQQIAVDLLHDDYKHDKELTIFTSLDLEQFYKTK